MEKKKFLIKLLLLSLCFPNFVFADTIILKSGQKIEGKIIQITDKYVKLELEGMPLTYYLEDIQSINAEKLYIIGNPKDSNSTVKYQILSKENGDGLEEGEQIVIFPNYLMYIHGLYKFKVILPPNWSKIYQNERKPKDLGKIVSIAFGVKNTITPIFHIMIKKTENTNIEDELKEHIDSLKESEGFKLKNEPERLVINELGAIKVIYSSKSPLNVVMYLILKDGVAYYLDFAYETLDEYNRYYGEFEQILKSIGIGIKWKFVN